MNSFWANFRKSLSHPSGNGSVCPLFHCRWGGVVYVCGPWAMAPTLRSSRLHNLTSAASRGWSGSVSAFQQGLLALGPFFSCISPVIVLVWGGRLPSSSTSTGKTKDFNARESFTSSSRQLQSLYDVCSLHLSG